MARELRTARVQKTYRTLYEQGDFFMASLSDVDSYEGTPFYPLLLFFFYFFVFL
jgi:hypothetical protein